MNTLYIYLKRRLFFIVLLISSLFFQNSITAQQDSARQYKKIYFDNGKLASEGFIENGLPNGYWKTYYQNGTIKTEGNRENFQLAGIWKFYTPEGKIEKEFTYKSGKKNGFARSYDEKGNLLSQLSYTNDTIQGVAEFYFPNGTLKEKSNFKNGLKDGETRLYHQDGRVIWLIQYEKNAVINREAINRYNDSNERTGLWIEFHTNERKKLVGSYVNDQKQGVFKEYDENGKLLNIYDYNAGQLVDNETSLNVIEQDRYYYPSGQVKRIETKQGSKKQGFTKTFDKDGNLILSQIFRNDTLIAEGNQNDLGQPVGLWRYYFPNGKIESTGDYVAGLKNGLWKYYFESGKLEQQGYWKMGKLDKKWEWFFEDGKMRCTMNFDNGKEDGDYIEYDQYNYVVAEGKYTEGYKVGKWYYSGGDQVEIGKYRDGLKEGEWKYYYYEPEEENLIFVGDFRDGEPDGTHIRYYDKGVIRSRKTYKAGIKNGEFVWYFNDGVEKYRISFYLDELESVNGIPFKEIEKYFE